MNHDILLLVFVGFTGFALMVQAIVVLFAFLFVRKTVEKLQEDVGELRSKASPFLTKSHEIMERVGPRIDSISSDVADITRRAREQSEDIHAAASEILERVNRQTSRVDNMFTSLFDSVEHAGNVVADSVSKPARQLSGVIAAARAFLNVIAKGRGPEEGARVTTDQDMFV
jgi:methyl-accepting chemotaxis protein